MSKERDSLSQELAQLKDLSVAEQQLLKNHFQQKEQQLVFAHS